MLERWKEELEIKLGTSDAARMSFAVFHKHGSSWISHVDWEKDVKLGPPVSVVEYPAAISSVLENKDIETGGDDLYAEYPSNPANLGKRDVFGRSVLHYATLSPWSNFDTTVAARLMINAQDRLGWTPLHFASSCDNGLRVLQLIQAGADTGLRTQDGLTPLHCAAMAGNFYAAVELINAGSDVNALDSSKNTPLHWAALNGHDAFVDFLLMQTNPMLRTTSGKTALHLAALGGGVGHEVLRRMLAHGYDGGAKDRMGRLALHYAALSGYEDGVVVLSEAGEPHLDVEDLENMRPVDLAASCGHQKLAERLLTQGALSGPQAEGISLPSISGTVLHRAAAGNCDELLGSLISAFGMNPSDHDLAFATPLHYAARYGSLAALKFLIESGVDMRADRTMFGATALHEAAENGHQDCVMYLGSQLGRGEPWPVDWSSRTPLHVAAGRAGNVHVLRTMLELGCPIDQQDGSGATALHFAAKSGDTAMADLLLNWPPQKAQIDAETHFGSEALSYAAVGGHLEMVKLLIKNGANIHKKNNDGQTPLLVAAECGMAIISEPGGPKGVYDFDTRVTFMERRVEVLRYLLEAGAKADTVEELGKLGSKKSTVAWKPQDRWTKGYRKMYLEILFLSGVINTPPLANSTSI
jgi:ankyrin repeat protein